MLIHPGEKPRPANISRRKMGKIINKKNGNEIQQTDKNVHVHAPNIAERLPDMSYYDMSGSRSAMLANKPSPVPLSLSKDTTAHVAVADTSGNRHGMLPPNITGSMGQHFPKHGNAYDMSVDRNNMLTNINTSTALPIGDNITQQVFQHDQNRRVLHPPHFEEYPPILCFPPTPFPNYTYM